MKKNNFTILLLLLVSFALHSQNLQIVKVCDLSSKDPLVFPSLISLATANKAVRGDFSGNLNLDQFIDSELLKIVATGYEPVIIYCKELKKLDTIYLKKGTNITTLGTHGRVPDRIVNSFIPEDYSSCVSDEEIANQDSLVKARDIKTSQLVIELRQFCGPDCNNLTVKFEVDSSGNLREFQIHLFEFDIQHERSKMIEDLSKYVLNNPRCMGSLKDKDVFGRTLNSKIYYGLLESK